MGSETQERPRLETEHLNELAIGKAGVSYTGRWEGSSLDPRTRE